VRRTAVLVLALLALTLAALSPLLGAGFLTLDDPDYVTRNPHVRRGLTLHGLTWAWTTYHAANWHPLTWISHMLDWSLFGARPAGHHATNLLLHAANAVLLLLLLARLTGRPVESALVAALFAIHPQHVESVAWVSERKDVLSTTLWLLTLAAYAGYARRPGALRMAAVGLALALGLCAKPMLVTAPFTLLLLDYWPLQRLPPGSAGWRAWRPLVVEKVPLLALAALSAAVTYRAQAAGGATRALELDPLLRAGNALVAMATYLVKTVWPSNLALFYPHPGRELSPLAVAGSALLLAALGALAWRTRRTRRYVLFGWLWFLGTLVPVLGLVQVGGQARADRYTYVPLIGIFIAVVWAVSDLRARSGTAAARTWPIAATLPLLALAAHAQARTWVSPLTAWGQAIEAVGPNPEFQAHLAQALAEAGRDEEAAALFERSLAAGPRNAQAHNNLSRLLARRGQPQPALAHALTAVELDPRMPEARINAGALLAAAGRAAEAEAHLREACRLDPSSVEAHNNLGAVLVGAGRADEAAEPLATARSLDPRDAKVWHNLGRAAVRLGQTAEARASFEQALALDPGYVEARNSLGLLLVEAGRLDAAVAQYEAALASRPDHVETLNNLGTALIMAGRLAEAEARLRRALGLAPTYAHAHANLAAAYYLAGRHAEAWAEVQQARHNGLEPPAEIVAGLRAGGFE